MKKNILLIFFILFSLSALAQNGLEDVVYLKNGSVIRGKILEKNTKSLKIESFGGNVWVYNVEDVEKITNEEPIDLQRLQKKGYYNKIQVFGYLGKNDVDAGMQFINGYQLNRYFLVGIGTGLEKFVSTSTTYYSNSNKTGGNVIPLFIELHYNVMNSRNTPFFSFKAGHAYSVEKDKVEDYQTTSYKGGQMISIEMGLRRYLNNRSAFIFSFGYRLQSLSEHVDYHYTWNTYNTSTDTNTDVNRVFISFAFLFN